jgi:hypothetical protein
VQLQEVDVGPYVPAGTTATNSLDVRPITGGTYNFRVRATAPGVPPSTWATYSSMGIVADPVALDAVTGLQVVGGGDTFTGSDCEIEWTGVSGARLKDYVVVVSKVDTTVLRTDPVQKNATRYTYTYTKNLQDTIGVPLRTFVFTVYARDVYDKLSAGTSLAVSNAAPSMDGLSPVLRPFVNGVITDWSTIAPTDVDLAAYDVFGSTTESDVTNMVATSRIATVGARVEQWSQDGLDEELLYYVRVLPRDGFGPGTASAVVSIYPTSMLALLANSITEGELAAELAEKINDQGGLASEMLLLENQWTVKVQDDNHIVGCGLLLYEPWDETTAYLVDDYVWHDDTSNVYKCISGHTNQEPPSATYWDLIAYGAKSEFIIRTDKFAIVNPNDDADIKVPFVIGTINGLTTIGMDGEVFIDGSVTAEKLYTGDAFIGLTIQSTGFVEGSAGWRILKTGAVEFNSGVFRGSLGADTVDANALQAGSVTAESVGANQIIAYTGIFGDKPPLGATAGSIWSDDFHLDNYAEMWEIKSGSGWAGRHNISSAQSGGYITVYGANNSTNDQTWVLGQEAIPFDPTALYRVKFRALVTVESLAASVWLYCGVAALDYAGNYIGYNGAAGEWWAAHWVAAAGGVAKDSTWHEYVGYFRGHSATGTTVQRPLASNPGMLHSSTRYFKPCLYFNAQPGGNSITYLDQVSVDIMPAEADFQWAHGTDTTYIDGGNIYTNSLSAAKITAGTITTDRLIGAAVTTSGSSYTASQKPPDFDTATVCSVTFTTIGGPVIVVGRMKVDTPDSWAICTSRLVIDGSNIISESCRLAEEWTDGGTTYPAVDGHLNVVYRHTPSAGSHTWQLTLTSSSTGDIYAKNAGLVVMELKR